MSMLLLMAIILNAFNTKQSLKATFYAHDFYLYNSEKFVFYLKMNLQIECEYQTFNQDYYMGLYDKSAQSDWKYFNVIQLINYIFIERVKPLFIIPNDSFFQYFQRIFKKNEDPSVLVEIPSGFEAEVQKRISAFEFDSKLKLKELEAKYNSAVQIYNSVNSQNIYFRLSEFEKNSFLQKKDTEIKSIVSSHKEVQNKLIVDKRVINNAYSQIVYLLKQYQLDLFKRESILNKEKLEVVYTLLSSKNCSNLAVKPSLETDIMKEKFDIVRNIIIDKKNLLNV